MPSDSRNHWQASYDPVFFPSPEDHHTRATAFLAFLKKKSTASCWYCLVHKLGKKNRRQALWCVLNKTRAYTGSPFLDHKTLQVKAATNQTLPRRAKGTRDARIYGIARSAQLRQTQTKKIHRTFWCFSCLFFVRKVGKSDILRAFFFNRTAPSRLRNSSQGTEVPAEVSLAEVEATQN